MIVEYVYLAWATKYEENDPNVLMEEMTLGIFTSYQKAEKAIAQASKKFVNTQEEHYDFGIIPYVPDKVYFLDEE